MNKPKFTAVICALAMIMGTLTSCDDADSSSSAQSKFAQGEPFTSETVYYGINSASGTIFSISNGSWIAASKSTHIKHDGELKDDKLMCTEDREVDIDYTMMQNDNLKICMDEKEFILTYVSKEEYASLAQKVLTDTHYKNETPETTSVSVTTAAPVESEPEPEVTTTIQDDSEPEETQPATTVDKTKLSPEALARYTVGYFSNDSYLLHIEDSGKDDNRITVELQILRTNPLYYSSEPGGYDEVYYLGNSFDLNANANGEYTYYMLLESGAGDIPVDLYWSCMSDGTIKCKIVHGKHKEENVILSP